jgi:hypothetical protein
MAARVRFERTNVAEDRKPFPASDITHTFARVKPRLTTKQGDATTKQIRNAAAGPKRSSSHEALVLFVSSFALDLHR